MDNTEGIKSNGKGVVVIDEYRPHPFGLVGVDFDESYPITSTPLYTSAQQQKPWVGLTPEDYDSIASPVCHYIVNDFSFADVAAIVEAKLKEKNAMNTTLNKIRSKSPCADGWVKLLKHLGKPQADDEPLSLITILDSNGLDDALWCLQAVDGHDREIRLYAVWCARQVQHLMTDKRSLDAIDVAERFANGLALKMN